jgi:multicomponent Na+:H+ antiporter subunit E
MNLLVLNLILSLAWISLTGEFTPVNFAAGFVLGYFFLWLKERDGDSAGYFQKVFLALQFLGFFMKEFIISNLRVTREILSPFRKMKPGIVAIPLEARTDLEITLFANLISLTPGTLHLDVSQDRKVMYVHGMFIEDVEAFRRNLKEELERRLLEVLR